MVKYTQKQLRAMVAQGLAQDITNGDNDTRRELETVEGWLKQVGYASGVYGCSGALFVGHNSGRLYAICARSTALFVFT